MKTIKQIIIITFAIVCTSFSNNTYAQLNELWCMEFIDGNTGITIGESGTIRLTNDGGANWITKLSATASTLKKTAILTDDNIIVVGSDGTILKTTDQGNSWSTKNSGTGSSLFGVAFGGRDNDVGIAVGLDGTIIRSTDSGESWSQAVNPGGQVKSINYRAVSFADENNGIIVGDRGSILISSDGGISWRTSGLSLPPVNYKFVIMLTENLAYATGENGTIIKTTDCGESWESIYTGVTNTLYRIRFADDMTALSVGTEGTVLKTTDGGSSWTNETSGTSNNLNCLFVVDENIAFTGGEEGIILKSTDGGLTWINLVNEYNETAADDKLTLSNYPNPSNPVSSVKYYVPELSNVLIVVYDITGKLVRTLVNEPQSEGFHSVKFEGSDLSSGTYFCRYITNSPTGIASKTMKIVLVK